MSDTEILHGLSSSDERPIPKWPLPEPPPSKEDRVYVLGMKTVDGHSQYYFVKRPQNPDPSKDGPLEIRVPTDCVIILKLDSAGDWEFRHENAIMLGPMNYPETPRYFNLVPEIINNRCQKLQFNALRLNVGDRTNRDSCYLYVNVDQGEKTGGSTALRAAPIVDIDIDNPGDPHQ